MILNKIFIYLISLYQKFLSNFIGVECKYLPSCSQYAKECFIKYNFFKAFFKTVWRILRCNPFSKGGLDLPVLLAFSALTFSAYSYESTKSPTEIMYLTSQEINLRSGPGTRYNVLIKLKEPGYPVIVFYSQNGWVKIKTFSGKTGWIKEGLVRKRKKDSLIIARKSNIFKAPREDAQVIAIIGREQLVSKIKADGDWVNVGFSFNDNKIEGWIKKENVWGKI